eukprot:jgi/Tetstr1/439222/TSEL_027664.t1
MLHRPASLALLAAPSPLPPRTLGLRSGEFSGRRRVRDVEQQRSSTFGGVVCSSAPPLALSRVRAERALQRFLGGPTADGLSELPEDILRQHVNIVHQRRGSAVEELVTLSAATVSEGAEPFSQSVGVHVDDGQLAEALSTILEGIPNPRLRQLLLDDISSLVPMFAGLAGRCCVAVKLELVTMTLCPRLHADSVPLRLLVTYAGAGTLYVIDGDVDRSRLLGTHGMEIKVMELCIDLLME